MNQRSSTMPADPDAGRLGARQGLWTPPSIDYTWRDRAGSGHKVEDISRVDFTSHHVVFWRDDVLVLAAHADSVHGLQQVEIPAEDRP